MNTSELGDLDLGLKRATVSVSAYSKKWVQAFYMIRDKVNEVIAVQLEVHHIGSTAVQGLSAKPILDMMLVFPAQSNFVGETRTLVGLGFTAKGFYGIPGRHFFTLYDEQKRA